MVSQSIKRRIAKVIGNFGVGFFTPLTSISIAGAYFGSLHMDFWTQIGTALVGALLMMGLSVSRELLDYAAGKRNG